MKPFILNTLIALLLTLSACGKPPQIESEFIPYVKVFEDATGKYADISIRFIDDYPEGDTAVAKCNSSVLSHDITVSQKNWDNTSKVARQGVILHELGHCILGLGHSEVKAISPEDSCATSIMVPNLDDNCVRIHMDFYLEELKNKANH